MDIIRIDRVDFAGYLEFRWIVDRLDKYGNVCSVLRLSK
jgi:hypothetical protein